MLFIPWWNSELPCFVLHGNGFEGETNLFKEKHGNGCGFTLWKTASLGKTFNSIVVFKPLSKPKNFQFNTCIKAPWSNPIAIHQTPNCRDLAHSGVFLYMWADTCDPGNENQENKKTRKPKKTKCLTLRFQDCCFHGSCNFVFFWFFLCVFWFHGSRNLVFFVSWVLLSWFVGFIARFPCDRHAGRCRCINVVNFG